MWTSLQQRPKRGPRCRPKSRDGVQRVLKMRRPSYIRTPGSIDWVRSTRQNDAFGGEVQIGNLLGAREHLGVDIELSQPLGD
jgi:hypothetical protein